MRRVATFTNGDSFSGQRTPAFSIGILKASVWRWTMKSKSTGPLPSVAIMALRR
jgi:hypothetical protein